MSGGHSIHQCFFQFGTNPRPLRGGEEGEGEGRGIGSHHESEVPLHEWLIQSGLPLTRHSSLAEEARILAGRITGPGDERQKQGGRSPGQVDNASTGYGTAYGTWMEAYEQLGRPGEGAQAKGASTIACNEVVRVILPADFGALLLMARCRNSFPGALLHERATHKPEWLGLRL